MSNTIDEKVVSLQFDNKNFEKNVGTSVGTLDRLKKSLNLEGASKGLKGVQDASENINMSGLANAVETVKLKFSALQVAAITVLANITTAAWNAGKNLVKSLTIDPITTGFSEYELKMGSIQTIMAGTGESLKTVNKYLQDLNVYSDKTIYSFADMTTNIGKFTNAGVGLEKAVQAIKGVSSVAAISGANANEASRAMYNFAQSLSQGSVRLMDWRSIENANMATAQFRQELMDSAVAAGTLTKSVDGVYRTLDDTQVTVENFSYTLEDQWLTSDALVNTLTRYADETTEIGKKAMAAATDIKTFTQLLDTLKESAQSGWATSWELIIGDFEEAKEVYSVISNAIGGLIQQSADARNSVLLGWKDAGGRTALLEGIGDIFLGVMNIVNMFKEAFREIFPPITSKRLVKITESFRQLAARFKDVTKNISHLKKTFKGLFAGISILIQLGKAIWTNFIKPVIKGIFKFVGALFKASGGISEWLIQLDKTIKKGDVFNKAFQKITVFVNKLIDAIKNLYKRFKEKFNISPLESLYVFLGKLRERLIDVSKAGQGVGHTIGVAFISAGESIRNSKFYQALKKVMEALKTLGKGIANMLKKLFGGMFDELGSPKFDSAMEFINTLASGSLIVGVSALILQLGGMFGKIKDTFDGISDVLDGFKDTLKAYQMTLKAKALMMIGAAILILATALVIIASIDSNKLMDAVIAISFLFAELVASLRLIGGAKSKGLIKSSVTMIAIAISLTILAGALKKIASLSMEELAVGMTGVMGLMIMVIATSKIMSKGAKGVMKGAVQMVIFAAALKILVSAVKDLAVLKWEELAKGLAGVAALMGSIAAFLKLAQNSKKTISTATSVVILASGIKILASAAKDFAHMSWEQITKGLVGIGALLVQVTLFTKATQNTKGVIRAGISLIAIGAAMKIFASAAKDFASMSWGEIAKGLVGFAGSLTAVVIALKLMPKNMISKGLGLIAVAAAMKILSKVLKELGSMSWEEIAKGLVTLGGAIAILAVGLNAMKKSAGGAAAMILASIALGLLAPTLIMLGGMEWEAIAKGLVAIAGAFAVMGISAKILKPLIPTIFALSGAFVLLGAGFALLGAGLLLAGTGILAIVTALGALVTIGTSGAAVIASSLKIIVAAFIEMIPQTIEALGRGLVLLLQVIIESAPLFGEAFKTIFLTFIDVLVECVPQLVAGVLEMVLGVLQALVDYAPEIIEKLFKFLIAVIDGITEHIPDLIKAFVNLIMSIFEGIIEAVGEMDMAVLVEGLGLVAMFAGIMAALAGVALLTPLAMAGVIGMGVVIAELAIVLASIGALAQIPGLTWLVNEGAELMKAIGNAIGSLIGGIVGGVMEGVTDSLPNVGTSLSKFMVNVKPFLEGAKTIDTAVLDGVNALVATIMALTGARLLDGITSFLLGGSSLVDFGTEIAEFGPKMKEYSDAVKGVDPEVVDVSVKAAQGIAEMAKHVPKQGGVVSWFTGSNTLAFFAEELVAFGPAIKKYSDEVRGVNVATVNVSVEAAKAISEMAENVPNSGGIKAWFAGDNKLSDFSKELDAFAPSLKSFSDKVKGVNANNVKVAVTASEAISQMADNVPNSGGIKAWFGGDNTLDVFGEQLAQFGPHLKAYSDSVQGVNLAHVAIAVVAAQAMVDIAAQVPNSGGVKAWFAGDNTLSQFGEQLASFAPNIKIFSESIAGVKIDALTMSSVVEAAKGIAEMSNVIPNEGGIGAWFAGDNTLADFAKGLEAFGPAIAAYSDAIGTSFNADSVNAAVVAATALAEMSNIIPNHGGVAAWFAGDNTLAKFAEGLSVFGPAIGKFSNQVKGFNAADAEAAGLAATMLAEMANKLPKEGGAVAWFAGERNMAGFAMNLKELGPALKHFSNEVNGINAKDTQSAASAAVMLSEMAKNLPREGGAFEWFAGRTDMAGFASNIRLLGPALSAFASAVRGFDSADVTAATNAALALSGLAQSLPKDGGVIQWFTGQKDLKTFGEKLVAFGTSLANYYKTVQNVNVNTLKSIFSFIEGLIKSAKSLVEAKAGSALSNFGYDLETFGSNLHYYNDYASNVNPSHLDKVTKSTDKLIDLLKRTTELNPTAISNFGQGLIDIGKSGVDGFISAFEDSYTKVQTTAEMMVSKFVDSVKDNVNTINNAGRGAVSEFAKGIKIRTYAVEAAARSLAMDIVTAFKSKYEKFKDAGKQAVEGFAEGIRLKTWVARKAASYMAQQAINSARKTLDERSPSRVFKGIGEYGGLGFVNGLLAYANKAYNAGGKLANDAKVGLSKTISNINDVIVDGIDTEPTIRPVIDLTNIKAGTSKIKGLFGAKQAINISSKMNKSTEIKENQNGVNSDGQTVVNEFTQNNYSPKALSRVDIYRQTRNLLTATRG